jgi:N-acetyl-gamma-glutamyl-phosphate reductase
MVYVIFKKRPKIDIYKLYNKFYKNEPFVRILGKKGIPELKNTVFTNFIDLGFLDWLDKNTYLIISSIDNLGKGASGQAIQNMNIALGIKETISLL